MAQSPVSSALCWVLRSLAYPQTGPVEPWWGEISTDCRDSGTVPWQHFLCSLSSEPGVSPQEESRGLARDANPAGILRSGTSARGTELRPP